MKQIYHSCVILVVCFLSPYCAFAADDGQLTYADIKKLVKTAVDAGDFPDNPPAIVRESTRGVTKTYIYLGGGPQFLDDRQERIVVIQVCLERLRKDLFASEKGRRFISDLCDRSETDLEAMSALLADKELNSFSDQFRQMEMEMWRRFHLGCSNFFDGEREVFHGLLDSPRQRQAWIPPKNDTLTMFLPFDQFAAAAGSVQLKISRPGNVSIVSRFKSRIFQMKKIPLDQWGWEFAEDMAPDKEADFSFEPGATYFIRVQVGNKAGEHTKRFRVNEQTYALPDP